MSDRMEPGAPSAGAFSGAKIEEARRRVIRYLSGRKEDRKTVDEAIRLLVQEDAQALESLRQVLAGAAAATGDSDSDASEASAWVGKMIGSLAELGEPADEPGLEPLPADSRGAAAWVDAFRDVADQRDDWLALSSRIAHRLGERSDQLVLAENVWHWATDQLELLEQVTSQTIKTGKHVLEWIVESPSVLASIAQPEQGLALGGAFHWGQGREPILALSLELPSKRARVLLAIVPDYRAAEEQLEWLFRFELDPGSWLKTLQVGVESSSRLGAGTRTVRAGRPADFRFAPPAKGSYYAFFEWKEEDGSRQTYRAEIPARST